MNINVEAQTPARALELMSRIIDTRIPFFLHGSPGIGKSDIVQQLADKKGFKLIVQMLTQMDATDLRGLQFVDEAKHTTVNYRPEWLPMPTDEPTIIFLDELPSAEPRLQVSAYQLLLSNRIGSYVLDPKHYVCGAGNKTTDNAVVYEMGSALASRLLHIPVIPEARSWLDWAQHNKIHPMVLTFIQLKGHMLEQLEHQLKQKDLIGPNPRQWARVSKIIDAVSLNERGMVEPLVEGLIGKAATKDFFLTVEEMSGLPDAKIILDMDDKAFIKAIPTKLPNLWGMSFSILAYANTKEQMLRAVQLFSLVMEHGPRDQPLGDVRTMGMEMLIQRMDKAGHIVELSRTKEMQKYMADTKTMIAIGKA